MSRGDGPHAEAQRRKEEKASLVWEWVPGHGKFRPEAVASPRGWYGVAFRIVQSAVMWDDLIRCRLLGRLWPLLDAQSDCITPP